MFLISMRLQLLAAALLGVVYTLLFQHWEAGLNVFLFDLCVFGAVGALRPDLRSSPVAAFAAAALLFSSLCVVLVHSWVASFTHVICFWWFLGVCQARELRYLWFSLLLGLWSLFSGWKRAIRYSQAARSDEPDERSSWRLALPWLRVAVLPAFLIIPFFLFYLAGNAAFAEFVQRIADWFGSWSVVDANWSLLALGGFGTTLGLALLLPRMYSSRLLRYALTLDDDLIRRRARPWFGFTGNLALLREYRMGVISFGFLNVLLFLVNAFDLRYVWFATAPPTAAELSDYVHAGTASLTASIFCAMLLVLVFFRGNLNFLSRSRPLYVLAYLWLAQNALLALSVAVRNGRYIAAYGLAEGRIIVAFFLLLAFLGLWSLYRKVRYRKSMAYLFQRNGLNTIALLLVFSALNWNVLISRYNLNVPTREGIDWYYLEHGLPGDDNQFLLLRYTDRDDTRRYTARKDRLDATRTAHDNSSWLAWNWPAYRNARAAQALVLR